MTLVPGDMSFKEEMTSIHKSGNRIYAGFASEALSVKKESQDQLEAPYPATKGPIPSRTESYPATGRASPYRLEKRGLLP